MRGNGFKHVLAENSTAIEPQQKFERWARRRWRLCWRCQTDRPSYEGEIKLMDGFGGRLQRFICKDCIEAKLKDKNHG